LRLSLLVTILVLAAFIRLHDLTAQSLWYDEGIAVDAATQPNVLAVVQADPSNPPLYFLLLHLTTRVTGDDLFALRWPPAMLGVLGVALAYQLGRRLFDETAGLFAAALCACSPLLWWASQEARMYGLLAVLATLAALAWHALRARPERASWLLLWGAELGLLYTHSTGPIAAVWLNVVTALGWLIERSVQRPPWKTWIAGQIGVALLWTPWLLGAFSLLAANRVAPARPCSKLAGRAHLAGVGRARHRRQRAGTGYAPPRSHYWRCSSSLAPRPRAGCRASCW
jgi:uncharacterized membrane protein